MATILLYQILFLFTSRFIIDTGILGPGFVLVHPPLLHHFDQGTPVHDNKDVTKGKMGRDMGFGHFSKLPQRKSNLDDICSYNLHRIIFFVSTPLFLWSKNQMKPLIKRLGHSYIANKEKSKMAARQNNNIYLQKFHKKK